MKVSQKQLDSYVEKWQRILRLQDWDVIVGFASTDDLTEGAIANIRYQIKNKKATIKIDSDILEQDQSERFHDDVEDTIIHELLHLHFAFLDKTKRRFEVELEQALEAIGPALYHLSK